MIRILRIWRVFWAMLTRGLYVRWKIRSLPEAEREAYRAHRQMTGCGLLCRILGIRVTTEGTLPDRKGLLVVSNHFGVVDTSTLATAMPVAFVAMAEMRKWPFLGWVGETFGVVFVDRERRTRVTHFAREVRRKLSAGVNVLVFPEGTTSPGEELLPFKTGAFEAVARQKGAAVLPVYLAVESVEGRPAVGNVRNQVVWASREVSFVRHCWHVAGVGTMNLSVRIGEPISADDRDRKELAQAAQDAVEALRDRSSLHVTAP